MLEPSNKTGGKEKKKHEISLALQDKDRKQYAKVNKEIKSEVVKARMEYAKENVLHWTDFWEILR